MSQLTAATAGVLRTPDRHGDGGTLQLHVAAGESQSRIQRITFRSRRHDHGRGPFPAALLAAARRPPAGRRRAQVPTVCAAEERTRQADLLRWRRRGCHLHVISGRQVCSATTWIVIELSIGRPRL